MNRLAAVLAAAMVITGCEGANGPTGLEGPAGPAGPTGPQGLQGIQGVPGATGPQGVQGEQGLIGPQGIQGAVGPTGPQGAQGIQGVIGPQGNQGAQGAQGLQGATGPKGDRGVNWVGAWSDTAVYAADDGVSFQGASYVATGATVTGVAPTTGAWLLLASRGDAGPAGPAGPAGAVGPAGPAGPQGDQGLQGLTGAVGPVGPQGPTGLTGAAGLTGATGAAGPMGPPGPVAAYHRMNQARVDFVQNAWTTLTSVTLPFGSYVINYAAPIANGAASDVRVNCTIFIENQFGVVFGELDSTQISIPASGISSIAATTSTQITDEVAVIRLACMKFNANPAFVLTPFTANLMVIRVDTIQ